MKIDGNVAESSTAVINDNPASFSGEQRSDWLKSGKLPSSEPKKEVTEQEEPPAGSEKTETAASSASAKSEQGKETGLQKRHKELDSDISSLHEKLRTRAELRRQLQEAEKPPVVEKDAKPKEESSASEKSLTGKPKPKYSDFEDLDKYNEALAEWIADEKIAAHEKSRKEAADKEASEKTAREGAERFNAQVTEAAKDHPDLPEVIWADEVRDKISKAPAVGEALMRAENPALAIYNLAKNPAEMDRILKISDPYLQVREVVKFELSQGQSGTPAAPKKKLSAAPPPPKELAGTGSVTTEEPEQAVEEGNFAAYRRSQNARDKQRLRR